MDIKGISFRYITLFKSEMATYSYTGNPATSVAVPSVQVLGIRQVTPAAGPVVQAYTIPVQQPQQQIQYAPAPAIAVTPQMRAPELQQPITGDIAATLKAMGYPVADVLIQPSGEVVAVKGMSPEGQPIGFELDQPYVTTSLPQGTVIRMSPHRTEPSPIESLADAIVGMEVAGVITEAADDVSVMRQLTGKPSEKAAPTWYSKMTPTASKSMRA